MSFIMIWIQPFEAQHRWKNNVVVNWPLIWLIMSYYESMYTNSRLSQVYIFVVKLKFNTFFREGRIIAIHFEVEFRGSGRKSRAPSQHVGKRSRGGGGASLSSSSLTPGWPPRGDLWLWPPTSSSLSSSSSSNFLFLNYLHNNNYLKNIRRKKMDL